MIKDVFLQKIRGVSSSTLRHGHYFTKSQVANEPVLKDFCEKILRNFKSPVTLNTLILREFSATLMIGGSIIREVVVPYDAYDKFNDGFSV